MFGKVGAAEGAGAGGGGDGDGSVPCKLGMLDDPPNGGRYATGAAGAGGSAVAVARADGGGEGAPTKFAFSQAL